MAAGDIATSREVYVAFAFAAADLLVEVDDDGAIVFAVGAAMALTNKPARALTSQPVASMFIPQDGERIERALARMDEGERVRLLLLHTPGGANRPNRPVALAGYRHPDKPGHRLLALTHASALEVPAENRTPIGHLLNREDFSVLARRMMDEGSTGADSEQVYQLTMLELPAVEQVRAAAGPVRADEFMAELGERLKAVSMGGDAAGELGENRYGVIHSPNITTTSIEAALTDLVSAFLPDDRAEPVKSASVALDAAGISSEEATNALLYSLNRFSQGEDVSLTNLARDVRSRLSSTVGQMREIKEVIDQGRFELVFQPIVDLWTDMVHHFECLVRFPGKSSPFETVTFAENVGIVGNLDMAILNRAINFMRSPLGNNPGLRFAVNLSGRSLSHAPTARRLLSMVAACPDLRGRMLFELTESAAVDDLPAVNAILQSLRKSGFAVCLDDFGAGSAAFHYLRALEVDHVKIDGAYIKEVAGSDTPTPYLKAIAQLCADLKVGTIAEFVETAETANLLKLLKVRHAQGYLYGKPMQPANIESDPMKGWAVNGLFWQNGLLAFRNQAPQARPIRFPTISNG
ncbi:EAL domain-containing protein [Magnetospirillum sulfuroxidans]|uniref:EAL domain-containing protein n=1 Tax=Magnetospirillum sulfuroxidans TaxID=611300 RepID=A0ABS5IBG5_9PROT|nr:EAL domain-containing protein [Magnetospirillum sulfuroxidans]MBR9971771.1 EAL domain-containing protein [Magnetospirillum sulfuroxidans]